MLQSLLITKYHFLGGYAWLNEVYQVMPPILYIMLGVLGGAGSVYAIILGINLAKADSDDTRKTAANRLRNTLIGVATLLLLVLFLNELLPLILMACIEHGDPEETSKAVYQIVNLVNHKII